MQSRGEKPFPQGFVSAVLSSVILLALFAHAWGAKLSEEERRGKQIYVKTVSPSGREITARVGKSQMVAPGVSLPCINCHGHDGVGLVESGVTATTITWEELTKPYGVRHITGREHPPYTEETLARAISQGLDPAGRELDVSMPRYTMSEADMADLIAYIRRIGTVLDPGLEETSIRVGTFLPLVGRLSPMGKSMESVLKGFFEDINRWGGVYGRRLELHPVELEETAASPLEAARRLMESEDIFALVGPFVAGAEDAIASLAEELEVPVVGPFTIRPADVNLLNRFTFYIYSGITEQVRAMLIFAREKLRGPTGSAAVVYSSKETPEAVLDAAERQARKLGWKRLEKIETAGGTLSPHLFVGTLKQRDTGVVIHLGTWEEIKAMVQEADRIEWSPQLYLPGSSAGEDLFQILENWGNRVYLAYATAPLDYTGPGAKDFSRFRASRKLPERHLAAQISSYCAAKIFVEGLKRTGRQLSREKFIKAMDGMMQFETGLTPPITYNINRRIGAYGSHVLGLDFQKKSLSSEGYWIPLDIL